VIFDDEIGMISKIANLENVRDKLGR
jgi:hypothetical protein